MGKSCAMRALRIIRCRDSMMWYAGLVGQVVPLVREEADCYWSREPAGYINIVRRADAQPVEYICTNAQECICQSGHLRNCANGHLQK